MDMYEYLRKRTSYNEVTCQILQDMISSVSCANIPLTEKEKILRGCMADETFSFNEIGCFAQNIVPELYEIVPVDVAVVRGYRIHVKVPKGSDSDAVKKAAKEEILNYGLEDSELDPCWDIEEDDIKSMDIDWDGVRDDE